MNVRVYKINLDVDYMQNAYDKLFELVEKDSDVANQFYKLIKLKNSAVVLAEDSLYKERLLICSDCKHMDISGTCMMCGCYVMLRSAIKSNKCPNKKW